MNAQELESLIRATSTFHDDRLAGGVVPTDRARMLADIIAARMIAAGSMLTATDATDAATKAAAIEAAVLADVLGS
ncbi:MAG: hypothetical protein AAF328_00390 [Planctomycetota bacterium]